MYSKVQKPILLQERIELIKSAFEETGGGKKEALDFSVESLKTIWKWFIPFIKKEYKSEEVMEEEKKGLPKEIVETLTDKKITVETMVMLIDISIYFAEIFIENNHDVQWGLAKSRSKHYINYNKPVLVGFKAGKYDDELDPTRIVQNLTFKVAFDGNRNADALYDMYHIWWEKLDKSRN